MSHFPPSTMIFFLYKFKFKDWIFHSVVICGTESCKRDGLTKTKLISNTDGDPLGLVFLFE